MSRDDERTSTEFADAADVWLRENIATVATAASAGDESAADLVRAFMNYAEIAIENGDEEAEALVAAYSS